MEHAKKYVLIDPQMHRQSMPEKLLNALDREIQSILHSDLPDDQKVNQYASALKRFRAYDDNTKPVESKISLDEELVDTLPRLSNIRPRSCCDSLETIRISTGRTRAN